MYVEEWLEVNGEEDNGRSSVKVKRGRGREDVEGLGRKASCK